jgi:hypothetical protein
VVDRGRCPALILRTPISIARLRCTFISWLRCNASTRSKPRSSRCRAAVKAVQRPFQHCRKRSHERLQHIRVQFASLSISRLSNSKRAHPQPDPKRFAKTKTVKLTKTKPIEAFWSDQNFMLLPLVASPRKGSESRSSTVCDCVHFRPMFNPHHR